MILVHLCSFILNICIALLFTYPDFSLVLLLNSTTSDLFLHYHTLSQILSLQECNGESDQQRKLVIVKQNLLVSI